MNYVVFCWASLGFLYLASLVGAVCKIFNFFFEEINHHSLDYSFTLQGL